jgi:hypothetical protein
MAMETKQALFVLTLVLNLLLILLIIYGLFSASRTALMVWAGLATISLLYGLPGAFFLGSWHREREVQARLKGIEDGLSVKKGVGYRSPFGVFLGLPVFPPTSHILNPPPSDSDVIEV